MRRLFVPAAAVLALIAVWAIYWLGMPRELVVYCAHDSIYAERILRDFERESGVRVAIRYDTEATKSLGLVELLLRERERPRCDVFWNNEMLAMLDLAERGVFEPYRGPGFARIPTRFKDVDGRWTGFSARMRVVIFNTQKQQRQPGMPMDAVFAGDDLSRVAMAKPLYGTTLTQYCALWDFWGGGKLQAWHRDIRRRGLREAAGNAGVKDLVAEGVCEIGITDTDDFFEATNAGKPVAMEPLRLEGGATICIPNAVAIVHGTKRIEDARKLVDFLLSEETELALANSRSRQIPLGPVPAERLPAEVRELAEWARDSIDLTRLGASRESCLAWLKAETLR